ncbi:MAG: cysteine synthase family protein [Candidatus Bathyarchaeota archaeon]|nr:cysteine synthase family protein [Candidatus Bathyarchaeota archaeon]
MYRDILSLVGGTPIVELKNLRKPGMARILVKLEYMNPTGSHKDRIATYMIGEAEKQGILKPGGVVVEASSGNTALSVAWVAAQLGYKAILVVEEGASPVKIGLIKALGAKVVEVSGGYEEALKTAEEIACKEGGVFLNQYDNEANVKAHYETTAREIYTQTGGILDAFVMGIGTCGTIAGVAMYLKEKAENVKIIGVVPRGAAIPRGLGAVGERIEGLSHDGIPNIYRRYRELIDRLEEVGFREALDYMRDAIKFEGIMGGLSTGANLCIALRVAEELGRGVVVTLAPDSVMRYLHLVS